MKRFFFSFYRLDETGSVSSGSILSGFYHEDEVVMFSGVMSIDSIIEAVASSSSESSISKGCAVCGTSPTVSYRGVAACR